jgi:hypothetical protein
MNKGVNVFYETPTFICMFPHLEETEKFQEQDTGQYSITMLFPKEEVTFEEVDEKINEAAENDEKVSKSKNWHHPLKDGDEMGKEWSLGVWVLKAKTKFPVKAVNSQGAEIDVGEIWNEAICRAHVVFRPFIAGGNKGVTCSLKDIQYIKGGGGGGGVSVPAFTPLEDVPF